MLLEVTFQSGDVYTCHVEHAGPQSPLQWSGVDTVRFLRTPQHEWQVLVLGSLLGGGQLTRLPPRLLQSPGGSAELEFSEDRAPLVCEHSDLLTPDDILFPCWEVTTHCGSLDRDPVLEAGLCLGLWVSSLGGWLDPVSEVREDHTPGEQASLLPAPSPSPGPEKPTTGLPSG